MQTQHFVESVTVGKMSFAQLEEAYGTAAKGDRIYADVYGMIGTQETPIQSNIDVTDSGADVSLKAEDGGCIYTGFKIAYHMQNGRDIPAGLKQDTPIVVTMRFHQESGEAICHRSEVAGERQQDLYGCGELRCGFVDRPAESQNHQTGAARGDCAEPEHGRLCRDRGSGSHQPQERQSDGERGFRRTLYDCL